MMHAGGGGEVGGRREGSNFFSLSPYINWKKHLDFVFIFACFAMYLGREWKGGGYWKGRLLHILADKDVPNLKHEIFKSEHIK